ncbi:MAG: hypothetical protein QOJ07_2767 [Thermoleophilaceae bacterium]|nr:hypothetical protein [Thermoleophilaceae bacterium]
MKIARRLSAAALVAGLVLVPATSASAADRCTAKGAKTVVKDSTTRVFYVKGKGEVKRRYFGCLRNGQKPVALTSDVTPKSDQDTQTVNELFAIGGPYVAWQATSSSDFGVGEFGRGFEAVSLTKGGRNLSVQLPDNADGLKDIAVRSDGAVAWILDQGDSYREVDGVPSGKTKPVALAYALGIGDAVGLTSDSATWTQDGAARSALLP